MDDYDEFNVSPLVSGDLEDALDSNRNDEWEIPFSPEPGLENVHANQLDAIFSHLPGIAPVQQGEEGRNPSAQVVYDRGPAFALARPAPVEFKPKKKYEKRIILSDEELGALSPFDRKLVDLGNEESRKKQSEEKGKWPKIEDLLREEFPEEMKVFEGTQRKSSVADALRHRFNNIHKREKSKKVAAKGQKRERSQDEEAGDIVPVRIAEALMVFAERRRAGLLSDADHAVLKKAAKEYPESTAGARDRRVSSIVLQISLAEESMQGVSSCGQVVAVAALVGEEDEGIALFAANQELPEGAVFLAWAMTSSLDDDEETEVVDLRNHPHKQHTCVVYAGRCLVESEGVRGMKAGSFIQHAGRTLAATLQDSDEDVTMVFTWMSAADGNLLDLKGIKELAQVYDSVREMT